MTSEPQIRDCLRRFAEAWARRDVDALLVLMTRRPVGPEPGRTLEQGEPEVFVPAR
jgi:hypothetical protein